MSNSSCTPTETIRFVNEGTFVRADIYLVVIALLLAIALGITCSCLGTLIKLTNASYWWRRNLWYIPASATAATSSSEGGEVSIELDETEAEEEEEEHKADCGERGNPFCVPPEQAEIDLAAQQL